MRSLLKLGLVVGMIVAFAAGAYGLSSWRAGAEKKSAVVVVIDPPNPGGDVIPLRGRASLYAGKPRLPTDADIPVDEAEEVNLENAEVPRFELNADAADGTRFFVYTWMELSNFDIYCESIALPRMRYVATGERPGWVDAKTGEPVDQLRVQLRKRCA